MMSRSTGGSNGTLKDFCMSLASTRSEKEVISALKSAGYWDDPAAWEYYGSMENNFSIIGNQQSAPEAALVEKIINGVDAVLTRECLRARVAPEGPKAPETLRGALEGFFKVKFGILSNLVPSVRKRLAENIVFVASGQKKKPSYAIIDKGEGQTPHKMPETFLSLAKSNKLRIPFVQGKFNMGGTGALQFCGKHNIQLLISRRDPAIAATEGDDGSSRLWGFTVVRREDPAGGARSSSFKYLAPGGKILSFASDSLPLLPGEYPEALGRPLEWGTFLKLYDYQIMGALRGPVTFDLYYRLAVLLPNIALPVLMYERRPGYRAKTYSTTLSGLSVRLDEDRAANIEPGFPSSGTITIDGQEVKIQIYVFKRDKKKNYATDEGVMFVVNGQSQGFFKTSFFKRKAVGMSYLADSIVILADCTRFSGRNREDLFMNSRDRLRSGSLRMEIERKLEELVKSHKGLRELKERRRREEIAGKISDARPLVEILERAIKNSPSLSKLFIDGVKITNPFNLTASGTSSKFEGKQYPTYFDPRKEFTRSKPKHCPRNQRFRVQFETDAANDYFTREVLPGSFSFYSDGGSPITDYVLNLWNGIANLTATLPAEISKGELVEFNAEVADDTRVNAFRPSFWVVVDSPVAKREGGRGPRSKPPGTEGEGRKKPSSLGLPNVIEVHRKEWGKYRFGKETALAVKDGGDDGYDFFVNMDNVYLLTEIRGRTTFEPDVLKAQYMYGMVLVGISLLKTLEESEDGREEGSVYEQIENVTRAIAPILIPMITTLSELDTA